jgi:MraZ protein
VSFSGIYRHSIDAKGRLIVPSRLRDDLEDSVATLIVMPDGCIGLWSGDHWRDLEQRLIEQRRTGDMATRRGIRRMAALTFQDQVDGQGRISIPQDLREAAGIEKDVVIMGYLDHVEIWATQKWDEEQATLDEQDPEEVSSRIQF